MDMDLIGGLAIPILALMAIGENSFFNGLNRVYENNPEKFNVLVQKNQFYLLKYFLQV